MTAPKSTPALDAAIAEAEALGLRVEIQDKPDEWVNDCTLSLFLDGRWQTVVRHWISDIDVNEGTLNHRAEYLARFLGWWRSTADARAAAEAAVLDRARTAWRPAEVSR